MIHRGAIVEKIVRKSGYSIAKLASELRISRSTLYNRFETVDMSWDFIQQIGTIIHHDFTIEFPELQESSHFTGEHAYLKVEAKYVRLLEKYNELLAIIDRIANNSDTPYLKHKIIELIEEQELET